MLTDRARVIDHGPPRDPRRTSCGPRCHNGHMGRQVVGGSAASASRYDALMNRLEARYFPDTRSWICRRASGRTLELAIGTGLNLQHYRPEIELSGVDLNPATLRFARARAESSGRPVTLSQADICSLPFPTASFDSVVGTFVLCEVADVNLALTEALRVLRPGGQLLLADHIVSSNAAIRLAQRVLELITIPLSGEHFTRRPSKLLTACGAEILASERFAKGAIERVQARKPEPPQNQPKPS